MRVKYPHVAKADGYVRDVMSGKIDACVWVRLACQRHLDDKTKSLRKSYPYRFDRGRAERICRFISKLPHIKGAWARDRQAITLEPWQCFILTTIYGWLEKSTNLRRFRKAFLGIPRKNAKSTMASAIGLYHLVADDEYGAEVYAGATTEKQAFEVFIPAKRMAEKARGFTRYFNLLISARNIAEIVTGGKFEPIIGQPGDGSSPSCAIHDEYHQHVTDEQVAAMETGMGARDQPMQLFITTAGDNLAGPCFAMWQECQKLLKGEFPEAGRTPDDRMFCIQYSIDKEDDWRDPAILAKANPNIGVSVSRDFLQDMQARAVRNKRLEGRFRTKHCNEWLGAADAYFDLVGWPSCGRIGMQLQDFAGRDVYIGLDLASRIDLAALVVFMPGSDGENHRVFGRYYLPEETVLGVEEHPCRKWADEGWITLTDGEIIDFDVIFADLVGVCKKVTARAIPYDPFQATWFATKALAAALPVQEYRQTVLNMSEPMKELDAMIRAGRLDHAVDPVLHWALSNVQAKVDAKDNVYPRRPSEAAKIDPAVALIMAIGAWIQAKTPSSISAYEKQELVII
jgi:phage terminase large subunit-like protein